MRALSCLCLLLAPAVATARASGQPGLGRIRRAIASHAHIRSRQTAWIGTGADHQGRHDGEPALRARTAQAPSPPRSDNAPPVVG